MGATYDGDVAAWADEQAALLRAGRFDALDLEHLADEIEDVGKSERRELMNRLVVLLAHLLRWQHQPSHRGRSWELTIAEQRAEIEGALADSPSMTGQLADAAWIGRAWKRAVLLAEKETGRGDFPAVCPWSVEDVIRDGWMRA